LKSKKEWRDFCESGQLPSDIPAAPWQTYKDKGWKGMQDWLGYETVPASQRKFSSYSVAQKYVSKLGLITAEDWRLWAKSKERPLDIPAHPDRVYKDKGWSNFQDWLGVLSYEKATELILNSGIRTIEEFEVWAASDKRPRNFPPKPNLSYRGFGWKGWSEWFGTRSNL
jgi:hypothetical protein